MYYAVLSHAVLSCAVLCCVTKFCFAKYEAESSLACLHGMCEQPGFGLYLGFQTLNTVGALSADPDGQGVSAGAGGAG